ncbi:MAG: 4-alpha-glucanotransferase [Bryobacteraceae bacterium]
MHSERYELLLDRAAELWGIDSEYWDIWGNKHITPPETKRAILGALGVAAGDAEQLADALGRRARKEWTRLLPPVLVVSGSQPLEFTLNAPADAVGSAARCQIRREDGGSEACELIVAGLPEADGAEIDGRRYTRRTVRLPLRLPLGYHELEASLAGQVDRTRLIVTPDHAWQHPALDRNGRRAGVAVALYGLRSGRNWGCGDFTDLKSLADWAAADVRGSFIALNPLHAIHNRRPFNASPYLPNCVFYQNFLYLDVEAVPDFARSRRALRAFQRRDTQEELAALRASEFIEYERVAALKLRFLKLAFAQFLRERRAGTPRAAEFRAFVEREGELLDRFAVYSALDEYLHRRDPDVWMWVEWPRPYQDPESGETRAFAEKHWRSVLFYKYVQWQIDLQLAAAQAHAVERGLEIGLYHDLALATDRFGSDLWAHRRYYAAGCRVGAPPDDFSPKGQDWAFPPPCSQHHRETGYRLFAESIRKNCRHGGALRIDHVMRFFRLYWIPEGMDATRGTYVRDRHEELLRILALESVRNRVVLIGEDLGTVEPFMREALARFGVLSYRLFYFEKDGRGHFRKYQEYPVQALVSSTTHDLPTIAGFWTGADIEARRRAGVFASEEQYRAQWRDRAEEKQKVLDLLLELRLLPEWHPRDASVIPALTGELHNAVTGFLALTPSQLLAINSEDLTKEEAQQNLPGTTWQYPNWCRKMRFTVEQLHSDPQACDFTSMFRNWLVRTGRTNQG